MKDISLKDCQFLLFRWECDMSTSRHNGHKTFGLYSNTTDSHILVVITVMASHSSMRTVKDALLLTRTSHLIQPDVSASCSCKHRHIRLRDIQSLGKCKCIECKQIQHLRWLCTPERTSGSPASYTPQSHPRCQSYHHTPFPRRSETTPPAFHDWVSPLNAPRLYKNITHVNLHVHESSKVTGRMIYLVFWHLVDLDHPFHPLDLFNTQSVYSRNNKTNTSTFILNTCFSFLSRHSWKTRECINVL